MKKFLTVLLALSVVFTYSFSAAGSAFAATGNTGSDALTHAEAMAQAEKEVVDAFNKNITTAKNALKDEYTETKIHKNCVISGSEYAATLDLVSADFANLVRIAAQKVDNTNAEEVKVDTLVGAIKAVTNVDLNLAYAGNNAIKVDVATLANMSADDLVAYVTADADNSVTNLQAYYMILTWANALDSMKAYLNSELAKVDMDLYTGDVADEKDPFQKTWKQLAQEAKDELSKVVADTTVTIGFGQTAAKNALASMYATVFNGIEAYKTVDTITGDKIVVSYKLTKVGLKTKEDLENEGVNTDANKAKLKALIQSNAATAQETALKTYNASKKDAAAKKALETSKENIAAYVEVNTVLIDEGKIKTTEQFKQGNEADRPDCLKRVKTYEEAVDDAATLKLQVEKDGSLKYIASKIDENLAIVKIEIYNTGKATTALTKDAENESDNLAWLKEVALANVDEKLNEALYNADKTDKYYAPEKAKVEAKYQAWKDKINATTSVEQLEKVDTAAEVGVSVVGIDTKSDVEAKIALYVNTGKFIDAVNQYIGALNIGVAPYADGYRETIDSEDADVVEYLAEKGARSNADVAGLLGDAEAYAKAIPTRGELKAEKAAVDTLVKEIPNVVTLADKPAIKAAWEAAKKADYFPTKLNKAVALIRVAESDAIDDMLKALPKTLTAADKDAVNAVLDAIKAYEGEEMYVYDTYAKKADAVKAFEAVRKAVLTDVQNTIAALPADATKAQVDAARAAVDAFVKEYTDAKAEEPYQAIEKIENLDKLTYAEAQVKANIIKNVKAIKVVKNHSVAGKGYIKIAWSTVGDTSMIDGYRVYRSTKANKGYKYIFQTSKKSYKNTKNLKKGTRYYYKVRAYVELDGKRYFSDFSNKANRKAK